MTTRQDGFEGSNLDRMAQQVAAWLGQWRSECSRGLRRVMVGAILAVALIAFEVFNYDTTEYALENLLGPVSFGGIRWATILAIAFCGIDFAGLARLITADEGRPHSTIFSRANWLILGAWLLGGGMNAIMTWWAVSLALMNHNLGNELLSRSQLLHVVPVLVAVLVWMTRILIISSVLSAADRAKVMRTATSARERQQATESARASLPAGRPLREPAMARSGSGATAEEPAGAGRGRPMAPGPGGRPNGGAVKEPVVPRPPRGNRPATVPLQMRRNAGGRRQDFS